MKSKTEMSKQIDLEKLRADAHRMAYVADQVRALEHKGSEADVYLTEAAQVFRDCAEVIAALEKDAERYKKLVQSGKFVPATLLPSCIWGLRTSGTHATKQELDDAVDAIDTAMEANNA